VLLVPYKGFGQGIADVLANQVPLIFGGITASIAYSGGGKLKAQVYRAYHIDNKAGHCVVDHLISLELGGSNSIANL